MSGTVAVAQGEQVSGVVFGVVTGYLAKSRNGTAPNRVANEVQGLIDEHGLNRVARWRAERLERRLDIGHCEGLAGLIKAKLGQLNGNGN